MRRFKALYLILLLSLIASLLSSCSRDPNVRKQKYFQSGQSYFVKGMYREAAIEYSNAIQIDSSYAEAHHQLAETYLKLQDGQHAAQELVRTVELQPQNQSARMELANLLIVGGDFQQAREQTDLADEGAPGRSRGPRDRIESASRTGQFSRCDRGNAKGNRARSEALGVALDPRSVAGKKQ